jgi:uncharacterized protein YciI
MKCVMQSDGVEPITKERFAIIYRPGPKWKPGTPFSEQDLRAHGAYIKDLYDCGILESGGPSVDDGGGLSVIRAESINEAHRLLARDPAIEVGVFQAELHPWMSVDWSVYER